MNRRTDTLEQPIRSSGPATTGFPRTVTALFRREPDRYSLKDEHSVLVLGLAIALHAAAVIGIAHYQSTPVMRFQAPSPMMVMMVRPPEPPKAEPIPVPQPPQPKPKPIVKKKPVFKPKPKAIQSPAREEPTPPPPVAPAARGQPETDLPPEPTPPLFSADYLNNPAPRYPAVSRRLGEKGRVLLKVLVNPQGRPEQVTIHRSSGFDRLDVAARDAVTHWTFVPSKLGTLPVRAWVIVPIVFTLRG
ncbi:MAG: energy transducer TonB [Gammaproteobacteria bacterium]